MRQFKSCVEDYFLWDETKLGNNCQQTMSEETTTWQLAHDTFHIWGCSKIVSSFVLLAKIGDNCHGQLDTRYEHIIVYVRQYIVWGEKHGNGNTIITTFR